MVLEVQSFFIYHNAGPIIITKFSISFQGPKLIFLIRLVLKFEMQQVPLCFAVS